MLKQRIITALLLAPLALWALFGLSDIHFLILFAAILLAGAWEWAAVSELKTLSARIFYLFCQAAIMVSGWWMVSICSDTVVIILLSAVLVWVLILFWLVLYEAGKIRVHLPTRIRILLGLILLPIPFLGMAFIVAKFANDRLLIMLLFLLIWGADVAAYTAGRIYGKTKLAPSISPGKTWEGVAGAAVMTIIVAAVAGWLMYDAIAPMAKLIVFSLFVIAFSIVGDLLESILKRQSGMKDSSHILPGHGGVLDRIDSLIAATPLYAVGIFLLEIA